MAARRPIGDTNKLNMHTNVLLPFIFQYIPAQGEPVVGVVIARHAEGYRVDIGSSQSASLDALAFEDATKRNKPDLKVCPKPFLYLSMPMETDLDGV